MAVLLCKTDGLQGRLINQSPVHLYDPINDYVNTELKRRSVILSPLF